MLLGTPIFEGNDEKEMIQAFVAVLGRPPKSLTNKSKALRLLDNEKFLPLSFPLQRIFQQFDDNIIDFLVQCLKWSPEERISAKEGLSSQWIKGRYSVIPKETYNSP